MVYKTGAFLSLAMLLSLSGVIALSAKTPNYVKTITYSSAVDYLFETISFTDGLGRDIQSRVRKNGVHPGQEAFVSGQRFDEIGRPLYKYKTFVWFTDGGWHEYFGLCMLDRLANDYHNDYAKTKTEYWTDPLNRVRVITPVGQSFAQNQENLPRQWYFGVKLDLSNHSYLNEHGFIRQDILTSPGSAITVLEQLQHDGALFTDNSATHFLSVSMDPHGNFTQHLKDKFGNTIRSANQEDGFYSRYDYSLTGNLIQETPPQSLVNPVHNTTYRYNTSGQILEKQSPDAGVVKYVYSSCGLLRFVQNSIHRFTWDQGTGKPMLVYEYDQSGRQTVIGVLDNITLPVQTFDQLDGDADIDSYKDDDHYTVKIRHFYDNLDEAEMCFTNTTLQTMDIDPGFSRGKLVCSVGFNHDGTKVIEIFTYDADGNISKKYKSIPGIALQIISYIYHTTGELKEMYYFPDGYDSDAALRYTYHYDDQWRTAEIKQWKKQDGSWTLVNSIGYQYNDLGLLQTKLFSGQYPVHYEYNIRDWVKRIDYHNGGSWFKEELFYNESEFLDAEERRFDGTIGRQRVNQSTIFNNYIDQTFTYDRLGRLIHVYDSLNNVFSANYEYDISGRITQKIEGSHQLQGYAYGNNNNQLQYIPNSSKDRTVNQNPNYIYDPNGNMVLDRSKNMAVIYDWRDMPLKFKFYDRIPDEQIQWNDVHRLEELYPQGHPSGAVQVFSYVTMMYDPGGNRVMKSTFHGDD